MGKKNKKKPTTAPATTTTLDPQVEAQLAEDMNEQLGDGDVADGEAAEASASAAGDKPKKEKTWLEHQLERARRAAQHSALTARMIRANHQAAKVDAKLADEIATRIEKSALENRKLAEDFLAKLPAGFEGIVPTRTGVATGPRKGFLKGVKVRMNADAIKKFSGLFTVDELTNLTVESSQGKMIRLSTPTNATIVIASKQVEEIKAAA